MRPWIQIPGPLTAAHGSIALSVMALLVMGPAACSEKTGTLPPEGTAPTSSYLPLTTGSWWEYDDLERREVVGPAEIEGRRTTVILTVTPSDSTYSYYSYESPGRIYLHAEDRRWVESGGAPRRLFVLTDPARLVFDASADSGESWENRYTPRRWEDGVFVPWGEVESVERVEMHGWKTVATPAGGFRAREVLSYRLEPVEDGYGYHRHLAPGVGEVSQRITGHGDVVHELVDYEIRAEP